jgi:hypothetical protein
MVISSQISWFKPRVLDEDEHDVAAITKRLARSNKHDMVCELLLFFKYYITLFDGI